LPVIFVRNCREPGEDELDNRINDYSSYSLVVSSTICFNHFDLIMRTGCGRLGISTRSRGLKTPAKLYRVRQVSDEFPIYLSWAYCSVLMPG